MYARARSNRRRRIFRTVSGRRWRCARRLIFCSAYSDCALAPDSAFANRARPCLLHGASADAARRVAATIRRVSRQQYAADVRGAKRHCWAGDSRGVETELRARMAEAAAAQLEFEKAAALRDRLRALSVMRAKHFAEDSGSANIDYIGVHCENDDACVNVVMVRGGRRLGERRFFSRKNAFRNSRRNDGGIYRATLRRGQNAAGNCRFSTPVAVAGIAADCRIPLAAYKNAAPKMPPAMPPWRFRCGVLNAIPPPKNCAFSATVWALPRPHELNVLMSVTARANRRWRRGLFLLTARRILRIIAATRFRRKAETTLPLSARRPDDVIAALPPKKRRRRRYGFN